MESSFYYFIEVIMLVIALSTDAFVACFAYGSEKIKIPVKSILIMDVICTVSLALSVFLGNIIGGLIPTNMTKLICFGLLFGLGAVKLFDSSIKRWIKKNNNAKKQLKFSLFNLDFILNIYANPPSADADSSKTLSPVEAATLAVALSLDGLAVGIGAGLVEFNLPIIVIFSVIANAVAIICGCWFGNKIAGRTKADFSFISGIFLMVLGFLKFI